MRVLLTGQTGYIGSVMTRVLLECGHSVVGLDTGYYDECSLTDFNPRVQVIRKDIRDVQPDDLVDFEAIVHLAALSNDPLGELKSEWTADINYIASVKLAQAAKAVGVRRFLFSSSCSIYGAAGDAMRDEEVPPCPLSQYAISKVRTEEDVAKLADGNFSPVFLRNATAYGVSPRLRADLVLNNLVGWAFTTAKVLILSDGTPWRPIVHIEDISRVFARILDLPREATHNQAINVGVNTENYQVRELAEIVREAVPNCRVEYGNGGGPDPRSYQVDFSKLTRLLPGFQFRWDARSGAKELYKAFRAVRLSQADFQGRKYIRLNQLRHLIKQGHLDDSLRWARSRGGAPPTTAL